jgi:hypothetical protein
MYKMQLEEIIEGYEVFFGRDIDEEPYDLKGYFLGVKVTNGEKSIVFDFYNPVRIIQEISKFPEGGINYMRFENTIVIRSINRKSIVDCIKKMIKSGFLFESAYS